MFKKAYLLGCLWMGMVVAILCAVFIIPRAADKQIFAALYNAKAITSPDALKSTDQRREGVRKDIYFTQTDGSRLHYRIDSETSILKLVPINHKFDVIEDLVGIKGLMQEKIVGGEQQLKYFLAKEGRWSYSKQEFVAKSVFLSLLKMPGKELPSKIDEKQAFLQGVASGVSFSFCGKKPNFVAEKFQASVRNEASR